ncbi:hypothetical protein ACX2VP_004451, partial [Cronobacter sakazakii]
SWQPTALKFANGERFKRGGLQATCSDSFDSGRGMDARMGRDAQRLDAKHNSPVLRQSRRTTLFKLIHFAHAQILSEPLNTQCQV